jgi:hypothetical protein
MAHLLPQPRRTASSTSVSFDNPGKMGKSSRFLPANLHIYFIFPSSYPLRGGVSNG